MVKLRGRVRANPIGEAGGGWPLLVSPTHPPIGTHKVWESVVHNGYCGRRGGGRILRRRSS